MSGGEVAAAMGREDLALWFHLAASTDPVTAEKLGDLLFGVVALARARDLDAEEALRMAVRRFVSNNFAFGGINASLVVGGWANYHRHTNAARTLRRLQQFMNNRVRRYLQYRRKGRGFGFWRYPGEKLYEMGVIQIHSGWVKHEEHPAHVSR